MAQAGPRLAARGSGCLSPRRVPQLSLTCSWPRASLTSASSMLLPHRCRGYGATRTDNVPPFGVCVSVWFATIPAMTKPNFNGVKPPKDSAGSGIHCRCGSTPGVSGPRFLPLPPALSGGGFCGSFTDARSSFPMRCGVHPLEELRLYFPGHRGDSLARQRGPRDLEPGAKSGG